MLATIKLALDVRSLLINCAAGKRMVKRDRYIDAHK
jgi:hypothetical protein